MHSFLFRIHRFFRGTRTEQLSDSALSFCRRNYVEPPKPKYEPPAERFSIASHKSADKSQSSVQYSLELDDLKPDTSREKIDDTPRYSLASDKISNLEKQVEESLLPTFTDLLVKHINTKGLRDTAVYRAAQMDRRLFSKIMSDRDYRPSKDTVLALIFALQLDYAESSELLESAGYLLSHSSKRDLILEYFIRERIHDLIDINLVLDKLGVRIIGR